ncbi:manganese-dependent inorganic pyrophosphatase [Phaeovulum sp.]|jgi:manganese-dependent inorganic pyrophosphatase|uniref:manganese-dependent inorganic pyrophosphatase n=1 Tax=Phaeovulum sp. TaxID=2934796 RepID=UPI00272F544A|nr:manganese-dependent inorganic pyrophosphatase [Phaeovulum sp.]MDP1668354.1 manganese-dependent inorganic pyrophosphatase [Phaeovulum sp.]MDZ4117945.1 manganese-dependent inorganic pyrophosphatase [Phaeovulum sp.]
MITVLGHKSPDTDATCSPIIWAWYLTAVKNTPARAVLLGEPNTEAAFVLKRWNLPRPPIIADVAAGEKVVIVDTNNPAELPPSINEANVIGIIDHHLLAGGIRTKAPIEVTIRPLACTATVLFDLMGESAARMPDPIKCAMLSCILSDTLEFRSPTTTGHDRAVAERLAHDLHISIPDYAAELFAAKSDVSAFSDAELLRMDSKEYEVAGKQLRVSVLETTAPQLLLDRKAALMAAMPGVAAADGADQVLLFIIDILREEATLLVPNALVKQIAEASFACKVAGDSVVLPGLMSRKKQIIPALKL